MNEPNTNPGDGEAPGIIRSAADRLADPPSLHGDASAIPRFEYQQKTLGWVQEAVQEGSAFLEKQPGYSMIGRTMRQIMSEHRDVGTRPSSLSSTASNQFAKIARVLVAAYTDVKPFWEYRTWNKRFERQAQIFGKLSMHWWLQRAIDLRFTDTIRYALAGGSAYTHVYFDPITQDLAMTAEDPRDVYPVRPSSYVSIQDCLGVIICRERTVNYLRQRYPSKASAIVADHDGSSASSSGAKQPSSWLGDLFGSPFRDKLFGGRTSTSLGRIPTTDTFMAYMHDNRRNESTSVVEMGERGTNWAYQVQPGQPLYPRGRLIYCTRTVILYDGPNPEWHGLFPVSKLTLDPWPWTWLGKSPVWDLLPLQNSLDRLLRVVDDHVEKAARPPLIGDKGSIGRLEFDKLDSRKAGLRIRHNPMAGKGVQIADVPPLDPSVPKMIEFCISQMNDLSGTADVTALTKLNQIPSAETVEKIMEAMTPSVRLTSRVIEVFMREFAMMTASGFAQYYTMPQRLAILGADGVTYEDFDFDPGSMIPDYVHDSDFAKDGGPTAEALARGPLSRYDRSKEFLRYFTFHVAPGSLLAASEITRKLLYLQLARAGLIDRWTLLEILGVPNVGEPPSGANTITARLVAEQELGLAMSVSAAGRKATGQTMPAMKPDGRVTESGG